MLLGGLALFIHAPSLMMAAGFGGLHIVLGAIIGKNHGG